MGENSYYLSNIYTPEGYLNIPLLCNQPGINFISVVGARNSGKTYGALKLAVEQYCRRFMLLRRTKTIVDLIGNDMLQPFKRINEDLGIDVHCAGKKDFRYFYENQADNIIGYLSSLSTFSNVRGADFTDIDLLIYDEFIPEVQVKPIKQEGLALLNLFNTMMRDREYRGKKPMTVLMLSNSDNIFHDVLSTLGLSELLLKMHDKRQNNIIIKSRHLLLVNAFDCPAALRQEFNTLSEFNVSMDYENMAIYNNFNGIPSTIISEDLRHYDVLYQLDDLYIYQHKTARRYYVTTHRKGTPIKTFTVDENHYRAFRFECRNILSAFYEGRLFFENITVYNNFYKKLDLKH